MRDFTGDPKFPIWLIGDSPPEAWADMLDTPLDPRHPARHNIWTPVLDIMQNWLYGKTGLRLDTSQLYIRNSVSKLFKLPMTEEQIRLPVVALKELLDKYTPEIVLTFGVSAFMITLFASGENPQKVFRTTKLLGEQFRCRVENYQDDKVNIIPLLHTSIARRHFLKAHEYFVDGHGSTPPNYFNYVGKKLANLLVARLSNKPIWRKNKS